MRTAIFALAFAMGALLTFDDAAAQAGFPPPPPKVSPAAGVIDMHIHSHPDVFGRNWMTSTSRRSRKHAACAV